jgi:hypothetical protein
MTAISVSADGSYIVSGNEAGSIDFLDASFSNERYLWRVAARDRVRSVRSLMMDHSLWLVP